MDLDRQTIEKRDFPFVRRGYDSAAVDAHLAALAEEVDALRRGFAQQAQHAPPRGDSLAPAAAAQVQAIVEAAETTASDIRHQAELEARRVSQEAARDAERTRDEAVARAQGHTEEVAKASALMLQRVGAMENEVSALIESLRTGANRLTADLALLEGNMGDLYDAAGRQEDGAGAVVHATPPPDTSDWADAVESVGTVSPVHRHSDEALQEPEEREDPDGASAATEAEPVDEVGAVEAASVEADGPGEGDVDVRLIALDMALNGRSREEADQYLAENFDIADRASLLDEVYSAVDG